MLLCVYMVCDGLRKGKHCVSNRNVKKLAAEWRAGLWIWRIVVDLFTHAGILDRGGRL